MSTAARPQVTADTVRLYADPLRLRIVVLLASEDLCTCHLVEETGAKQPTVSHHLRVLREAGVVDTEAVGSFTYYRLRAEALEEVAAAFSGLAEEARPERRRRLPCD